MPHTSEKRWSDGQGTVGIVTQISVHCSQIRDALLAGEEEYQQLQELFQFAGGTVQGLADQLFYEQWSTRLVDPDVPDVFETQANATEVSLAQDAVDAMTSIHEIFQAADNVAVAQADRLSDLRRMI